MQAVLRQESAEHHYWPVTYRRHAPRVPNGDRKLALAVIFQALEDATDPHVRSDVRRDALDFLEGRGCVDWCLLAELDAGRLRKIAYRSARLFTQNRPRIRACR